jgi:hypothetical protein
MSYSVDVSAKSAAQIQSATSWRKAKNYKINEIYCDFIEELDAIVDKQGNILHAEINGTVNNYSF